MASRPPSQRPSASSQPSSSQSSSPLQSPGSIRQAESIEHGENEETIVLGPTPARASSSRSQQRSDSRPQQQSQDSTEDIRRCWICFSDETEDTPLSSSWRSPCPCALTAHEACLLDWVSDLENSNKSNPSRKILCPQCKSEIVIARPKSVVVETYRTLDGMFHRLLLPSVTIMASSSVVWLSATYGVIAANTVLGPEDVERILMTNDNHPVQTLRQLLGFSAIPWVLIFSRTSMADSVLPIVPMIFLATQAREDPLRDISTWPPSASLSFALLPYVRALYNSAYEHVWGEKERRWLEEVKPRSSSEPAGGVNFQDENVLEIDILDDNGDGEERIEPQAPALDAPPLDQAEANQAAGGEARPRPDGGLRRRQNYISLSRLAQSVLGALIFPGISALMGDLLRATLPARFTALSGLDKKPTKFLQTRWGRSIVGGCLFVVLKDAVTLYVRWRMAQDHRKRQVLDYDKVRGKVRAKR